MGNAGVGKTTMAKAILRQRKMPRLSLDEIAWNEGVKRKPHKEAVAELIKFIQSNSEWIIEGCYSDLIEEALPYCTELRFLNPGIEISIRHCKQRPWEPEKFGTAEAQDANLENLIQWVRTYETREDEYGLKRHRKIYDEFSGNKREFNSVDEYKETE